MCGILPKQNRSWGSQLRMTLWIRFLKMSVKVVQRLSHLSPLYSYLEHFHINLAAVLFSFRVRNSSLNEIPRAFFHIPNQIQWSDTTLPRQRAHLHESAGEMKSSTRFCSTFCRTRCCIVLIVHQKKTMIRYFSVDFLMLSWIRLWSLQCLFHVRKGYTSAGIINTKFSSLSTENLCLIRSLVYHQNFV